MNARRKVAALAASLLMALGLGLSGIPAAQASGYALCMKNVTTSQMYFTVQFQDQGDGSFFNDAINVGEISGECGNTNVFSEPVKFRIPPGNHARIRERDGACGSTVAGAWSGYYNAPANYYPNGRWVTYAFGPNTGIGGNCVIWETEMRTGLT